VNIIIFDSLGGGIPGLSWKLYSKMQPGWERISAVSWSDAMNKLGTKLSEGKRTGIYKIDTLQLWSHGQPGKPLLNNKPIESAFVKFLSVCVTPKSLVWFRSCSVFYGQTGLEFAERTVQELHCRVAGHTRIIGWPRQSGLYSVRPNQHFVDPFDQIVPDWKKNVSSRTAPHTIWAGAMTFPNEW